MVELLSVTQPKFAARIAHNGDDLILELLGTADVPARHHLSAFLRRMSEEAVHRNVARMLVDIRKLAFMNSSCFKDLICWLDQLRANHAFGCRVVFRSNAREHWQKRSLHALACFARELVTVEAC